jgi:hypothetical protein
MTGQAHLGATECWRVSGLRNATAFFRAIPQLLPEATIMFLEGSPALEILAVLANHSAQAEYGAPTGTLWSWPLRDQRFTVRASSLLFAQLADASAHHAEPEICSHLHFYRNGEPLAQWFDAFDDAFLVSKVIPRARLEEFTRAAGGELTDSPIRL